ncbi:MAG: efflux RND transporter permease subunit, partial [bacterium]
RTLQDWLVKYELKSVPEVSQVLSIGGEVRQFQVLVDPAALLKYDLTLTEIMDRIESSNRNAAAGFITRGHPFGREMAAFQEEITHMLDDLPGISLNLTQPIAHNLNELLTGSDAQLAVRVVGEDFQELQRLTGEIEAVLGELEGAVDIQTQQFVGQNNLVIHLDRGALARHGVPVERVQRTVEAAIGGVVVGQVYEGRRRFDIFLRFQPEYRGDTRRIHQLLIPLPGGGRIPLGQVARVEETEATRMISREESRRYSTVQCNVRGRDMGRFAEEARGAVAGQVELPAGYIVRWGGQFELQERSRRTFLLVTPLTLLLVSILLYSIFGSIREAAVILINIPLALIGGLAALVLTGQYMSVPASIGFIAIFGILPLLLASGPGAEILLPLATVVVGGLLTSTLVTLIVLPLVYQAVLERTAPHPAGSMTGPEGHGGRAP